MLVVFTTISLQAQNKLLSSISQYNSLGTWENSYANNYEYDTNNNLVGETGLRWANGVWKRSSVETYSYNSNNKVTQDTYEDWNPETNAVDYKGRTNYGYTDNRITLIEGQEWKNSNWVNEYKITVTYNSNNLPNELIEFEWIGSQWVNEERTTYTYNANGKIISSVFEEWLGSQWVNSEKTVYTYNINNKLITDRGADWDDFNGNWAQNGDKTEYEWDATGNKTQDIDYYRYDGNNYQYKDEYTYDTTKLMSSFAHPFKDKTGFDYFEEGGFPYVNKLLSENSFSYNSITNSFEISSRTTYNYNNAITLSTDSFKKEVATITVYPNPTSDYINIHSESNTGIDTIIVTDLSGKKVLEQNKTSRVDVQNLSKGIYLLQISVGDNKETRKFIKK